MSRSSDDYPSVFEGEVRKTTAKAVLLRLDDGKKQKEVWLPRSQCSFDKQTFAAGDTVEVTVPEWLVEDKEIDRWALE